MSSGTESPRVNEVALSRRVEWTKALTFVERLQRLRSRRVVAADPDRLLAEDRFARWAAQTSLTGEPLDLLSLHRCTNAELRWILGDSTAATHHEELPPDWFRRLESVYVDANSSGNGAFSAADEPTILGVFEVAVRPAKQRLTAFAEAAAAANPGAPFDAANLSDILFASLALRLEFLVGQCVVVEMHAARLERRLTGATSRERYTAFLRGLAEPDSSAGVLATYPVLARLIVTTLDDWIEASEEFIGRLAQDWPALRKNLAPGVKDDQLVSFEARGDPHCRGRRVAICTFRSGLRLVYKPRPVTGELHFQDLLRWVNEYADVPALRRMSGSSWNLGGDPRLTIRQ